MLQPTVKSKEVKLTEDEKDYFAKTTDEDLRKLDKQRERERENGKTNTDSGFSSVDYYNGIQGKQNSYNDPAANTRYRIGCRLLAEFISKHITDKNAQILDAGAGSGFLAVEVRKCGFLNIDCLEPSRYMINMQPEDLYGKVYEEMIRCAKQCTIETGSYDCVMLMGSVCTGLIEVEDFPELLRIVKPGGHVIFNISDYWNSYKDFGVRLDGMLQASLESGTLMSVVKERIPYIYPIEDATVHVLKKSSTTS